MSSSPAEECRSPVGLDCCSCCLDLANRSGLEETAGGENNNLGSPTVSSFRQLQEQLVRKNLNTDKLSSIMRQDSLEPVVRDPCYLFNQGICNRNIDQTLLSILLLFHSASGASVVAIDNKIEQAMVSCSVQPLHLPRALLPRGDPHSAGGCWGLRSKAFPALRVDALSGGRSLLPSGLLGRAASLSAVAAAQLIGSGNAAVRREPGGGLGRTLQAMEVTEPGCTGDRELQPARPPKAQRVPPEAMRAGRQRT
uniref:TSC22 domain family member 3 n=1 Tax=Amazona collaria TaxID=241587 RepID=A0A8B9GIJ5_9PSIT